tara:strand:+ start:4317 stop:4586 length:270 start_codon:yes stop_codon:yes gene_type:complete
MSIVGWGLKELINRLIVYYTLMFLEGIRELELIVFERLGTHVLTLDMTATAIASDTTTSSNIVKQHTDHHATTEGTCSDYSDVQHFIMN